MCGRFSLVAPAAQVFDHYGEIKDTAVLLAPRYNIAPSQNIVAVRAGAMGWELRDFRWGLIPHWAKQPETGFSMINARAESVASKPAFRALIRRRRCLIPTDGFFEWEATGSQKQPWRFTMKEKVFSMAGLWDHWEGKDGQVIESATIITTNANDLVRRCHDRMPVIIDPTDYHFWLDPGIQEFEALRPLLVPHPVAGMDAYPVTSMMGKPSFNGPDAVNRLKPETWPDDI